MKIIYSICGLFNSGGMERIITQKANYLADVLNHEIIIITTDQKNRPIFFPLSKKVKHIDLGINYGDGENDDKNVIVKVLEKKMKTNKHFKRLNQLLIKEKADIVITTINNDLDIIPRINDGSKKICEFHFSKLTKILEAPNLILKIIQTYRMKLWKRKFLKFDKFIVLTEEDKTAWGNMNNIMVIPNFIDNIPEMQLNKREKRVICVGRAVYQKGFDLMLNIWAYVTKKIPDWELYIFGNGNKTNLEKLIKELGLQDSVHLKPATINISEEYNKSSIYALSSRYEGLPMVLLEAMAHGLPVVSFACPCGPKDVIRKDFGSVVNNGDLISFANELILWMTNENRIKKGSLNAYKSAQLYKKENIMNKWEKLFKSL